MTKSGNLASNLASNLERDGWLLLPHDPCVAGWAAAALPFAMAALADPVRQGRWLRHGGTWFVGLDALPNAADGSIGGVPLAGGWRDHVGWTGPWHQAQLSVVYPGYPGRDATDTDAAHRFRLTRDAAHLDGVLAVGPAKRRFLREPHAFVLGIGLNAVGPGASPLVVWDGSQRVMGAALSDALAGVPAADWSGVDLTEAYQAARAQVFASCPRRIIAPGPGQAVLVHRLAVHGVAPWTPGAVAPAEGRIVAYFRPVLADPAGWLAAV